MNEQEINISITTLIVSSGINLISILGNFYVLYIQYKDKKIEIENGFKRRVIREYYLPVKYLLIKLKTKYLYVKEEDNNFSVFELYVNKPHVKKLRDEILEIYNEYILLHENLTVQYADNNIDCKLIKLYSHMQIVLIFNNNPKLSKYSANYALPDISELIKEIDLYVNKYNIYI